MDLSTITVAQFKTRFYRDFSFANQNPVQTEAAPPPVNYDFIQDTDIQNAYNDAMPLLNQGLFSFQPGASNADAIITQGFLYLAAHCLCLNIKAADAGVNSTGTGGFPVASRSVGSVSESYSIPKDYTDDPILAQYTQTAYGMKYLAMVLPALRGNFGFAIGGAQASGSQWGNWGIGFGVE